MNNISRHVEIKELQPGNWVQSQLDDGTRQTFHQIIEVHDDWVTATGGVNLERRDSGPLKFKIYEDTVKGRGIEDLFGIPLTQEIVEKAGFLQEDEKTFSFEQDDKEMKLIVSNASTMNFATFIVQLGDRDGREPNELVNNRIYFVHQLQNAFFDKFNFQLNLKL